MDFNARIIREFRASGGKVLGPAEGFSIGSRTELPHSVQDPS